MTVLSNDNTPSSTLLNLQESDELITAKKINESSSLIFIPISEKNENEEETNRTDRVKTSIFCASRKDQRTSAVKKRRKQISKHKIKVNRFARTNLSRISLKPKSQLIECSNCMALESHYQNEQTQQFLFIETFAQEKDKVLTEK